MHKPDEKNSIGASGKQMQPELHEYTVALPNLILDMPMTFPKQVIGHSVTLAMPIGYPPWGFMLSLTVRIKPMTVMDWLTIFYNFFYELLTEEEKKRIRAHPEFPTHSHDSFDALVVRRYDLFQMQGFSLFLRPYLVWSQKDEHWFVETHIIQD
jgi:hypothetical protein